MQRRLIARTLQVSLCLLPVMTVQAQQSTDMVSAQTAGNMHAMEMEMNMQGGAAPPDARDPHAYADGQDFGPIPRPLLADQHEFGSLLLNRLENLSTAHNHYGAYDLQASYGRTYDQVVVLAEGHVDEGRLQEGRNELLWRHALDTFWNAQLGARFDTGVSPDQGWLAAGVQGLSPYWFEIAATAYLSKAGQAALRVEAEYELLFTQRLILQPRAELSAYGRSDPAREVGSGIADLSSGLRLRYEFTRDFAPYLGYQWQSKFGQTAAIAKDEGVATTEPSLVAGVRMQF